MKSIQEVQLELQIYAFKGLSDAKTPHSGFKYSFKTTVWWETGQDFTTQIITNVFSYIATIMKLIVEYGVHITK